MRTFENGDVICVTKHRFQAKFEHLQMRSLRFQSFSSALLCTGENNTKTPFWMKIFRCVFGEMKTKAFENGA